MKVLFSLVLIASASAFAPPASKSVSSSLKSAEVDVAPSASESASSEVAASESASSEGDVAPSAGGCACCSGKECDFGALVPLGKFDPLGFLEGADQERFDDLRLKELTHGRVSMLAFTGYITTLAGFRFPGCEDVPSGLAALENLPSDYLFGMTLTAPLFAIVMNDYTSYDNYEILYPDMTFKSEFPGDFRNGAVDFGWDKFNAKQKEAKRLIELNNGRAAQMGILGLMVHEKLGNLNELIPGL